MTNGAEMAPETDEVHQSWSLVKVFDLAAFVLVVAVIARVVGGIVAAAGVPSFDYGVPALNAAAARSVLPTYARIAYATSWADLTTGLLLLVSLALLVLPRIVWTVPPTDQWPRAVARFLSGTCLVASVTAAAGAVNIVNTIWKPTVRGSLETVTVAQVLAAVAISGLAAVLAWFSMPYLQGGELEGKVTDLPRGEPDGE